MDGTKRGALDFLKQSARRARKPSDTGGAKQLAMLRRIPKILRFIPGAAQDVRAYFLTLQYWLAGSDENVVNLVRFLVNRYAGGAARRPSRRAEGAAAGRVSRGRRLSSARCRAASATDADALPRPPARRSSGRSASC